MGKLMLLLQLQITGSTEIKLKVQKYILYCKAHRSEVFKKIILEYFLIIYSMNTF